MKPKSRIMNRAYGQDFVQRIKEDDLDRSRRYSAGIVILRVCRSFLSRSRMTNFLKTKKKIILDEQQYYLYLWCLSHKMFQLQLNQKVRPAYLAMTDKSKDQLLAIRHFHQIVKKKFLKLLVDELMVSYVAPDQKKMIDAIFRKANLAMKRNVLNFLRLRLIFQIQVNNGVNYRSAFSSMKAKYSFLRSFATYMQNYVKMRENATQFRYKLLRNYWMKPAFRSLKEKVWARSRELILDRRARKSQVWLLGQYFHALFVYRRRRQAVLRGCLGRWKQYACVSAEEFQTKQFMHKFLAKYLLKKHFVLLHKYVFCNAVVKNGRIIRNLYGDSSLIQARQIYPVIRTAQLNFFFASAVGRLKPIAQSIKCLSAWRLLCRQRANYCKFILSFKARFQVLRLKTLLRAWHRGIQCMQYPGQSQLLDEKAANFVRLQVRNEYIFGGLMQQNYQVCVSTPAFAVHLLKDVYSADLDDNFMFKVQANLLTCSNLEYEGLVQDLFTSGEKDPQFVVFLLNCVAKLSQQKFLKSKIETFQEPKEQDDETDRLRFQQFVKLYEKVLSIRYTSFLFSCEQGFGNRFLDREAGVNIPQRLVEILRRRFAGVSDFIMQNPSCQFQLLNHSYQSQASSFLRFNYTSFQSISYLMSYFLQNRKMIVQKPDFAILWKFRRFNNEGIAGIKQPIQSKVKNTYNAKFNEQYRKRNQEENSFVIHKCLDDWVAACLVSALDRENQQIAVVRSQVYEYYLSYSTKKSGKSHTTGLDYGYFNDDVEKDYVREFEDGVPEMKFAQFFKKTMNFATDKNGKLNALYDQNRKKNDDQQFVDFDEQARLEDLLIMMASQQIYDELRVFVDKFREKHKGYLTEQLVDKLGAKMKDLEDQLKRGININRIFELLNDFDEEAQIIVDNRKQEVAKDRRNIKVDKAEELFDQVTKLEANMKKDEEYKALKRKQEDELLEIETLTKEQLSKKFKQLLKKGEQLEFDELGLRHTADGKVLRKRKLTQLEAEKAKKAGKKVKIDANGDFYIEDEVSEETQTQYIKDQLRKSAKKTFKQELKEKNKRDHIKQLKDKTNARVIKVFDKDGNEIEVTEAEAANMAIYDKDGNNIDIKNVADLFRTQGYISETKKKERVVNGIVKIGNEYVDTATGLVVDDNGNVLKDQNGNTMFRNLILPGSDKPLFQMGIETARAFKELDSFERNEKNRVSLQAEEKDGKGTSRKESQKGKTGLGSKDTSMKQSMKSLKNASSLSIVGQPSGDIVDKIYRDKDGNLVKKRVYTEIPAGEVEGDFKAVRDANGKVVGYLYAKKVLLNGSSDLNLSDDEVQRRKQEKQVNQNLLSQRLQQQEDYLKSHAKDQGLVDKAQRKQILQVTSDGHIVYESENSTSVTDRDQMTTEQIQERKAEKRERRIRMQAKRQMVKQLMDQLYDEMLSDHEHFYEIRNGNRKLITRKRQPHMYFNPADTKLRRQPSEPGYFLVQKPQPRLLPRSQSCGLMGVNKINKYGLINQETQDIGRLMAQLQEEEYLYYKDLEKFAMYSAQIPKDSYQNSMFTDLKTTAQQDFEDKMNFIGKKTLLKASFNDIIGQNFKMTVQGKLNAYKQAQGTSLMDAVLRQQAEGNSLADFRFFSRKMQRKKEDLPADASDIFYRYDKLFEKVGVLKMTDKVKKRQRQLLDAIAREEEEDQMAQDLENILSKNGKKTVTKDMKIYWEQRQQRLEAEQQMQRELDEMAALDAKKPLDRNKIVLFDPNADYSDYVKKQVYGKIEEPERTFSQPLFKSRLRVASPTPVQNYKNTEAKRPMLQITSKFTQQNRYISRVLSPIPIFQSSIHQQFIGQLLEHEEELQVDIGLINNYNECVNQMLDEQEELGMEVSLPEERSPARSRNGNSPSRGTASRARTFITTRPYSYLNQSRK